MEEIERVPPNYFDIDDIVAKCESTSCTFDAEEVAAEFYGEMLGIEKPTLNNEGCSADAPLWIIESIKKMCTVNLPQGYSPTMQSILTADAKSINLARQEQYFYAVGMELCRLMDDPEAAYGLSKCLLSTLTQRLGGIIATALHGQQKSEKLANLELKVFEEGVKRKQDIDNWLREKTYIKNNKRKLQ